MSDKKKPKFSTAVHCDAMQKLWLEACSTESLLDAKHKLLAIAEVNGATLESIAEKLQWPVSRLKSLLLDPKVDIPIRELSDITNALGREVKISLKNDTSPPKS